MFKIFSNVSFKKPLSTMASTKPCSNWNSALWKPSGSFCPMVCSITLGPANPINAFGSARMISPSIAKDAVTPPVVGSVKTGTNRSPASECFFNAADVFAICIRETIPSCILAPPEQQNRMTGSFSSVARSTDAVILSPTTCPILPIKNLESITPSVVSFPPMVHLPINTPSDKPVFSLTSSIFPSYPGKSSGFPVFSSSNQGVKLPSSATIRILFFALTRK